MTKTSIRRSATALGPALVAALCSLAVLPAAADEPRIARARRGANLPPSQIADRAFKPVDQIKVEVFLERPLLPEDSAKSLFAASTPASPEALRRADWKTSVYAWTPPEFFHRPLFYEDVPLERYGHSVHPRLQPAVSTVKFYGDVALLPYRWLVESPRQWVSPLGYERPGDDAYPVRERFLLPGEQPRRGVVERPILDGQ